MKVDEIRLSNSMTVEYNALTPGSVGQIAAQYDFSRGAPDKTVSWLFYDRLGNVQGTSDIGGDLLETMHQDAYGNVLSDIGTGQWASTFSGRHLTTKEYDADSELYYFWQRWYTSKIGRFACTPAMPYYIESPYLYTENRPLMYVDPSGDFPEDTGTYPPEIPSPPDEGEITFPVDGRTLAESECREKCHISKDNCLDTAIERCVCMRDCMSTFGYKCRIRLWHHYYWWGLWQHFQCQYNCGGGWATFDWGLFPWPPGWHEPIGSSGTH